MDNTNPAIGHIEITRYCPVCKRTTKHVATINHETGEAVGFTCQAKKHGEK